MAAAMALCVMLLLDGAVTEPFTNEGCMVFCIIFNQLASVEINRKVTAFSGKIVIMLAHFLLPSPSLPSKREGVYPAVFLTGAFQMLNFRFYVVSSFPFYPPHPSLRKGRGCILLCCNLVHFNCIILDSLLLCRGGFLN
jgi:hypothetical protein